MKYTLTNQPQKINETKGEIENLSPYTIVLAAGTTTPTEDTARITVKPWGSYSFKVALGESLYAWIINEESGTTTEVSVVNFSLESEGGDIVELNEQIQNLSKKLPKGTILAVDYRKGVTAQDENGNLIEPNGIPTVLGHDNGVFYNADGSFQGQRDRVKGLWAGKETANLVQTPNTEDFLVDDLGGGIYKFTLKEDATTANSGRLTLFKDTAPLDGKFFFITVTVIENNINSYYEVKESATIGNNTFTAKADFKKDELNVTKIGSGTGTASSTSTISFGEFVSGITFPFKKGDNITLKVQLEESPIATPFCEKNRGNYQMSYPIQLDRTINKAFIFKFEGKINSEVRTSWFADGESTSEGKGILTDKGNEVVFNEKVIDGVNTLIINTTGMLPNKAMLNMNDLTVGDSNSKTIRLGGAGSSHPSNASIGCWGSSRGNSGNIALLKVIVLDRNLTAEEIELYSNSDIDIPDVGEFYSLAYSKKRTDQYGAYKRGWKVVSTDEDIPEIKNKRYKITDKLGAETTVYIDENGVKTGNTLDQVNGYLRVDSSVVLPCDVEVL